MLPLVLSIAGSLLPSVVSALVGSKTEEEARAAVKPKYDAIVQRMLGAGKGRQEATQAADEAIKAAVQEEMGKGAIPGWAEALLGVAGGIGGWAAGAKLAAKAGQLAVKGGQAVSAAAGQAESAAAKGVPRLKAPSSAEMDTVDITRLPDDIQAPFPRRGGGNIGMGRRMDAPPAQTPPPAGPAGLERQADPLLEFSPVVGSGPAAQPMTPREDFRRMLAEETRRDPKAPPAMERPAAARLGYDPDADLVRQMRENPDFPPEAMMPFPR